MNPDTTIDPLLNFLAPFEEQPAISDDFLAGLFKDSNLGDSNNIYSSPSSVGSSPTSTSSASFQDDSPPSSLLQDDFLNGLFVPDLMLPPEQLEQQLHRHQQQQQEEQQQLQQQQQQQTFTIVQEHYNQSEDTAMLLSPPAQEAVSPSLPNKAPKKKQLPHGQTTVPITINTHKSRPARKLECFNCKVTKTPLWRRTPDRAHTLCNACGLYYKQYNHHRPLHVRHKTSSAALRTHPYCSNMPMMSVIATLPLLQQRPQTPSPAKKEEDEEEQQPSSMSTTECVNCHQTQTPLWRKNDKGEPVCNACGLYARLHHRDRPIEMRKTKIQRRRRDWQDECDVTMFPGEAFVEEDPSPNVISPATSPSLSVSPLPSAQEEAKAPAMETEDSKFLSLLVQMNRDQMQGFLNMLEHRCSLLRTVLDAAELARQVNSTQP